MEHKPMQDRECWDDAISFTIIQHKVIPVEENINYPLFEPVTSDV